MGRLFWKFFLFMFLAQLTTTIGVGAAIWLRHNAQQTFSEQQSFEENLQLTSVISLARQEYESYGIDGLKDYLNEAEHRFGVHIFALDQDYKDLLGRPVPRYLLDLAENPAPYRILPGSMLTDPDGSQLLLLQSPPREFKRPPRPSGMFPGIPLMPIFLGLIASLIFAGFLAWYFSKPIRNLRQALDSAADGKLDERPGHEMGKRNDELADLARQYDLMAGQLHKMIQSQKRLLHDVSHEMRSPLARQQAAIDLARQQPDKMEYSMDRLERELVRIDTLVGELLALSRLEADINPDMEDQVDIAELLAEIADDSGFEAKTLGKRITYGGNIKAEIQGNYELLRRAIENVVRNAVKHTPVNHVVDICPSLDKEHGYIRIDICDEGTGVPGSELDDIFEPFFQGRSSELKSGYGLGLAIAKRIIIAHGGEISAQNRAEGGLCVVIILPKISG